MKYSTQDLPSFPAAIENFLGIVKEKVPDVSEIKSAVIGIAGPVFGGEVTFQLNIKHWCPIREKEVEVKTGLKRVVLLNDFVANGYGVLDLKDNEKEILFEPSVEERPWKDESVKVVLGIGTGLGSCQLTRAPGKIDYHVNSLESGMQRLPLYDEDDKRFDDFL